MKKYGLVLCLAVLAIFGMTSCRTAQRMANDVRYEVSDMGRFDYNIGDNLNTMRFNSAKIRRRDGKNNNYVNYDHSMFRGFDYDKGNLNLHHEGKNINHRLDKLEGATHINTSSELKNLENKTGVYFIKAGDYEVDTLNFNQDIALIGLGKVNIRVTGYNEQTKPITFNQHATLVNVNLDIEGYENTNGNAIGNVVNRTNTENRFFSNRVSVNGTKATF